jgi:thiopurine S-methyltransferase
VQHSFWNERWQGGQTAFHLPQVNPHLVRHAGHLPPASRVLVPLCGKTHDLAWLAARGHEVWGVEFVEQAARAFFAERGLTPAALTIGALPALRHGAITIVVGDLFALDVAAVGRFPAIYDRAALIAVQPERQRPYLQTLRQLATDAAPLLLITTCPRDRPSPCRRTRCCRWPRICSPSRPPRSWTCWTPSRAFASAAPRA